MHSPLNLMRLMLPAIFPFAFFAACTTPEEPVSAQEAVKLAHAIEKWIKNDSAENLNKIIDASALSKRIEEHAGNAANQSFLRGVRDALKNADLGQQIARGIEKKGSYLLIKQYEKDKQQHLVFRLYADAQVNYHDFELIKKDDQVKVADIFIYLTGETLSATLANSMLMMTEDYDDMPKEEFDKIKRFKIIKTLMSKNNYNGAKRNYDELPDQFKKQKIFQLINIMICKELEDSLYLKAMDEYHALYPAAPNMFLMMIDAYILQQEYENALKSVNQLDSLINKDPLLDYHRALIYKQMDDYGQYQKHLETLNHNMPDFGDGNTELIYCYLETGEMSKAVELTKKYMNSDEYTEGDLDTYFMLYPSLEKAVNE
jgi:hypothetical protein